MSVSLPMAACKVAQQVKGLRYSSKCTPIEKYWDRAAFVELCCRHVDLCTCDLFFSHAIRCNLLNALFNLTSTLEIDPCAP